VPYLVVQPIYYLDPDEAPKLRLLAAIERNCRLDQVPQDALPTLGDPSVQLHWLSSEEVARRFGDFSAAMETVGRVASRCAPALPERRIVWPSFAVPERKSPQDTLREVASGGLRARYGQRPERKIQERLERELRMIASRGYAPFFLIVADIVRFAREANLPVSTRGSVANSLVAYCSGITTVDPVEHDLIFERFLNPARQDLPDIDLDFCSRRRDEVLEYVRKTYGADRMALVGSMNTLRPRSAVRETAKAYGLEEGEIDRLSAVVPRGYRHNVRLEHILDKLDRPEWAEIVRMAFSIVGQPDHLSLHPGGVIITPQPLTEMLPVQWSQKGFLVTQYDFRDLEELGLPKLDLLGIRALTVMADAAELVCRDYAPDFRVEDIPFEDKPTQDLLASGETIGVFQCESLGAMRTLRGLRARTIRDLAIANAFFRPGPLMGGMAESFIRRYRGEEPVAYLHLALEPILGITRGVLIFQEQVLRIGREIAGLSWEQADQLRRGISKSRSLDMGDVERLFIEGCQRLPPDGHGLTREQAKRLWEQVIAFSGFGFNQGHATAYADVSYRSAYMKAHWPAAFLCARLADRGGYHHPAIYMAEAVRLGIRVLPPHVNRSGAEFTLTWEGQGEEKRACLWMGLDQVRDLRKAAIRAIIDERHKRSFFDLHDLLGRVKLQTKEVMHLVQCGALDELGESRSTLLTEAGCVVRADGGQMTFPFAVSEVQGDARAQILAWEQYILGQPVSVNPLELLETLPEHIPLRLLVEETDQAVSVVGFRLPGWTGGEDFFLGDGDTFVVTHLGRGRPQPPVWKPHHLLGQWKGDGMGNFRFQVDHLESI
jgi:DNA polymerase-3 subunit alpha